MAFMFILINYIFPAMNVFYLLSMYGHVSACEIAISIPYTVLPIYSFPINVIILGIATASRLHANLSYNYTAISLSTRFLRKHKKAQLLCMAQLSVSYYIIFQLAYALLFPV